MTVEQVWGRPAIAELRDRLATADGPHEMLTLLEEELLRRLCETAGLGLVRHTGGVIAAAGGAVAIGDLSVAAGVSSTHLAQRFKELIGVTPKRLARTYRFAATVFSMSRSNSYKSASSPISNLRASQSRGEPCGQGGHVQLGVGGRLRRGRE